MLLAIQLIDYKKPNKIVTRSCMTNEKQMTAIDYSISEVKIWVPLGTIYHYNCHNRFLSQHACDCSIT